MTYITTDARYTRQIFFSTKKNMHQTNTNSLQWASNNYVASAISSEQDLTSKKSMFNIFHLSKLI